MGLASALQAQPAGLDPQFGSSGKTVIPFTDDAGTSGHSLVRLSDGKLLAGYSVYGATERELQLIRYTADGLPDAGFGTGGVVTIPSPVLYGEPTMADLALQADGKLILALDEYARGSAADFLLLRLNADGSPDLSFGTNGYARAGFASRGDCVTSIKVQPDGKIVAGGFSADVNATLADFAAIRFLPDGTPDPVFGTGGMWRITFDPIYKYNQVIDVEIQSDGKILLTGKALTPANSSVCRIRLLTDGSMDPSFASGGPAIGGLTSTDTFVRDAVLQPDGKLVVLGSQSNLSVKYALLRYLPDGEIDDTFGVNGVCFFNPSWPPSWFGSLALLPDGKILAAGSTYAPGSPFQIGEFMLVCFTPEGNAVTDFGGPGYIRTPMADSNAWAGAMLVQPDAKAVLTGAAVKGGKRAHATARYFTGPLTVNEVEGITGTALLYPNPTQGELTLSYTLTAAQTLKLDLLDVTGKVTATFPNLVKPAGKYEEQLRLPETLPAGTYYLLIRSDKGHTTLPFVKQ